MMASAIQYLLQMNLVVQYLKLFINLSKGKLWLFYLKFKFKQLQAIFLGYLFQPFNLVFSVVHFCIGWNVSKCFRILGPTALQEYSERGEDLPSNSRPLYCQAMLGMVLCFTGFRKKDELVCILPGVTWETLLEHTTLLTLLC